MPSLSRPPTEAEIQAELAAIEAEREAQRERQATKVRDGVLLEPQWKGRMKHVPRVEVVRRGR